MQARLYARPVGVEHNRVQIDLVAVVIRHRKSRWSMVEHDAIAESRKRFDRDRLAVGSDRKVEIGVLARLLADQRIDAPAAAHPDRCVLLAEYGKDGEHVERLHGRVRSEEHTSELL